MPVHDLCGGDRTRQDDAGTIVQSRYDRLHAQKNGAGVRGELPIIISQRDCWRGSDDVRARVCDVDISATKALKDKVRNSMVGLEMCDIAYEADRRVAERVPCCVDRICTAPNNDDRGALGGEELRSREAYSAITPVMTATLLSNVPMCVPLFQITI
jgi:hypothetical protein